MSRMGGSQNKKDKKQQQVKESDLRVKPVQEDTEIISSDSVFAQSIIKKNKNKLKNSTADMNNSKMNETYHRDNFHLDPMSISDDSQGFTTVTTKNKGVNKLRSEEIPEAYRKKGYDLIILNQKSLASQYLSKAIEYDPTDIRHFVNRSYCYLNTGEYNRAIDDIHHVITHISNHIQLSKMKCREAQALWGLQNYEDAETCFNDSLNFVPNSVAVKCERLRMRVVELTSLGFPEKVVLELLHDNPEITIKDAVTFLSNNPSKELEEIGENGRTDDIYHSDCDDNPSHTRLFMNIIGFDGENEDDSWHQNFYAQEISGDKQWITKNTLNPKNNLRVIHAAAVAKSQIKKQIREPVENSVWVGGINSKITEKMLKTHFSKFGKVLSAFLRTKYAFINFQEASSAQKAIEASSIKIGDVELQIKSGKRSQ